MILSRPDHAELGAHGARFCVEDELTGTCKVGAENFSTSGLGKNREKNGQGPTPSLYQPWHEMTAGNGTAVDT